MDNFQMIHQCSFSSVCEMKCRAWPLVTLHLLPTSSDSEDYALYLSEYEHSDVEFVKEQSDISVDTDGDDSYELQYMRWKKR